MVQAYLCSELCCRTADMLQLPVCPFKVLFPAHFVFSAAC